MGSGGIELRRKEAFGGRVGSLLFFHFTGTLIFHANSQATQEKFGMYKANCGCGERKRAMPCLCNSN